MAGQSLKDRTIAELEGQGFRPARWLPEPDAGRSLRPLEEVAARLMALHALFSWVVLPEDLVATDRIEGALGRNDLRSWLTDEEGEILSLDRAGANEAHAGSIGWKLENMWPLAWVLGFEPPPSVGSQVGPEVARPMIVDFIPGLGGTVADAVAGSKPRTVEEVIALEYRFYCAHNAVRSAQLGRDTVPRGFHPIHDGGAVHERRHGLTWCLSPAVSWEETDLST
ncbi:DUF4272 domain-containing protein [Paludisphaera soli]|uniref:DUF4272 domain-containing protein n=1 Tax=Paludisphaera soli TaxID=2712865 RepID=UPI0013EAB84F|nr:DUF4272 domain-containing protein [Paludisphaera soli]